MTYGELLNKFLAICPVDMYDYRPFETGNSICVWLKDGKAIQATYVSDDEFIIKRTTTEEWANKTLPK